MKKLHTYFRFNSLLFVLFFVFCYEFSMAQFSDPALFVVADAASLNAAETNIDSLLTEMGFTVTLIGQAEVTDGATAGTSLVLISATVSSGTIATNIPGLPTLAVPVINWEPFLYDFLGHSELDGGEYNTTEIQIVGEGHQMAAGLTNGVVTISTVEKAVSYGAPIGNIEVIAVNAADNGQAVIFGYDEGAEMFSGYAPARRVGTFLLNDVADTSMTAEGWALFIASVKWAMNYVDPSAIDDESQLENFVLQTIYPNPFDLTTNIEFSVPVQTKVQLSVCNALGVAIAVLVDEIRPAGEHMVSFDASELPGGVYFCRLVSGSHTFTKPMLLIK